jgi:NADH:ubiquinone oxidoreductase subunit 3 (subunit A)
MKTHKEQMKHFKKYDPITHYEVGGVDETSNDFENIFFIIMCLFIIVGVGILLIFLT